MALVDSLLTAMVRANGDALVMHVGEKPYVVTATGPIDLSTHGLNLQAMTGMLAQLIPADGQHALREFGAVEHTLPSLGTDQFTVVAARGGDDIWIEIRRRRPKVAAPKPPQAQVPEAQVPQVQVIAPPPAPPVASPAPAATIAHVAESPIVPPTPVPAAAPRPEPVAAPRVEPVVAPRPDVAARTEVAAPRPDVVVTSPEPAAVPAPPPTPAAPKPEPVVAQQPEPVAAPRSEPSAVPEPEPVAVPMPKPAIAAFVEPRIAAIAASVTHPVVEAVPAVRELRADSARMDAAPARDAASPVPPPPVAQPHAVPSAPAAATTPSRPAPSTPPPAVGAGDDAEQPLTRTVRIEVPARTVAARQSLVERLLRLAASRGASALFLASQARPYVRIEGDMRALDGESPLSAADVDAAVQEVIADASRESVRRGEPTDWIADIADLGGIRCTSFRDHRGPGALFRIVSTRTATAEQLVLPREIQALATEADGLVLVASPPGSGKSTLLSAFVDLINRQRADYVITLERQPRLIHENRMALISQREVRGSGDEMLAAARAALRENPDVLVVEDVDSAGLVPLILDAAGQGLLVFVSMTVGSSTDAVQRFIDLAPAERRDAAQAALAHGFRGSVAQVLLRKAGGGRVAARELLLGTGPVSRLIADGQFAELSRALEGGRQHGMVPLTDTLVGLVQSGAVDVREAWRKASDRERLLAGLRREGIDTAFVEQLA